MIPYIFNTMSSHIQEFTCRDVDVETVDSEVTTETVILYCTKGNNRVPAPTVWNTIVIVPFSLS